METHFDTKAEWLDALRHWASNDPRITALWLFGSRASGIRRPKPAQKPIPDLDIAFEVSGNSDQERLNNAFAGGVSEEVEFSQAFGVPVDLQWLDASNPRVTEYVKATGVLIFSRSL